MSSVGATPLGERPIFVVGPSRSGTTMMRLIVNQHSLTWVTAETHYFDDLRPRFRGRVGAVLTPAEAKLCEDYFLALAHRPYGRGGSPESATRVTRGELREAAARLGDGPDAYFRAYCETLARHNGRERWGEKTPRHVFRIPEMLALWPEAKVICMVRDPRAVVSSYRYWKAGDEGQAEPAKALDPGFAADEQRARRSYNVVVISLLWRSAVRASLEARRRFGEDRVRIQRYEPILRQPEASLRELASWLGLEYLESLLDVPVLNSSFGMRGRVGISSEPLERWRSNLPPAELSVIQTCCGSLMDDLAYSREPVKAPAREVARAWATTPVAFARAFVVNRRRMGNVGEYLWRRLRPATSRGGAAGTLKSRVF